MGALSGLSGRSGLSGLTRLTPPATELDPNAQDYINRVEAADGQTLETSYRTALNNFVLGCKADGIWNELGAACILAGARTLSGALIPLVGPTPTNVGFTSAHYNRNLGVTGGTGRRIMTGFSGGAIANVHLSVWATSYPAAASSGRWITGNPGTLGILNRSASVGFRVRSNSTTIIGLGSGTTTPSLVAQSRSNTANFGWTGFGSAGNFAAEALSFSATEYSVLAEQNGANAIDGRIAFYSVGNALSLTSLSNRVATLMAEITLLA